MTIERLQPGGKRERRRKKSDDKLGERMSWSGRVRIEKHKCQEEASLQVSKEVEENVVPRRDR